MYPNIKKYTLIFWFLLLISATIQAQTAVVAHVDFVRGDNVAEQNKEKPRPLTQGSAIYLGDSIKTSERGFVIVQFVDGAKITVRPNSIFSVNQYDNQSANQNAQMVLHQGGVSASTGTIAKQHPENFQIKTKMATVKAAPADYSVQLCEQNCNETDGDKVSTSEPVAARVVELKGVVSAKTATESQARQLSLGDALYSADSLQSQPDSYALLAFADGEKITLNANSQLEIKHYSYQHQNQPDKAAFRLLKGGMRVLTGLIGKSNPAAYSIDTPVATLGIRGTGFDVLYIVGVISDDKARDLNAIQQGFATGLYCYVWQGQITLDNKSGQMLLSTSESGYIGSLLTQLLNLPKPPESMLHSPAPRPDSNKLDLKLLFPTNNTKRALLTGVYVTVYKGQVKLESSSQNTNLKVDTDVHSNQRIHINPQGQITRQDIIQQIRVDNPVGTDNQIKVIVSNLLNELEKQANSDNPFTINMYQQLVNNIDNAIKQHVITQQDADALIAKIRVVSGNNITAPTPPSAN
jgi:hypothetical protein